MRAKPRLSSTNESWPLWTQGMRVKNLSKNIVDFDLTDHLTKASYEVETNKIHLEVESFDDNGDSIPPIAYKPTFDYIDATSRKIKIHVDHFEHYAPEIEFSDVHLWVEFFKSDGTYSDQVKGRTSYENGTIIKKDIDSDKVRPCFSVLYLVVRIM